MEPKPVKVIDSLWTFLIAVAVAGPFALPLLWRNPRFKVSTKVIASTAVIAWTYLLTKMATSVFTDLLDQYQEILKSGENL